MRYSLQYPDGSRRADLRADADHPKRLVPRFCLATGADIAAFGHRGGLYRVTWCSLPLISNRWTGLPGLRRILPICTPGRRHMCPVQDGSAWILLPDFSRARGISRFAARPITRVRAPVSGATDVAEVTFEFDNKVFRIHEDPRVTKPYSEEQWAQIMQVGYDVEKDLQEGDVRLTMGGEPTFISIDDFESPNGSRLPTGP
jgi:hypothetical protein